MTTSYADLARTAQGTHIHRLFAPPVGKSPTRDSRACDNQLTSIARTVLSRDGSFESTATLRSRSTSQSSGVSSLSHHSTSSSSAQRQQTHVQYKPNDVPAYMPKECLDLRDRLVRNPTEVSGHRTQIENSYGSHTGEFMERFGIYLVRELTPMIQAYVGIGKADSPDLAGMPYLSESSAVSTLATRVFSTLSGIDLAEILRAKTPDTQAKLARIISDVLVVIINTVGGKVSKRLEPLPLGHVDELDGVKAKLDLTDAISTELASYIDEYREVRQDLRDDENSRTYHKQFIERMQARAPHPTLASGAEHADDAARAFDFRLAEKIVDKIFDNIVDELPDHTCAENQGVLSAVKALIGDASSEGLARNAAKHLVSTVLAVVLGKVREVAIEKTSLREYLLMTFTNLNTVLEVQFDAFRDGVINAYQVPTTSGIKHKDGLGEMIAAMAALGLPSQAGLLRNQGTLKSTLRDTVGETLVNALKDPEGGFLTFASLLDSVLAQVNENIFLVDGHRVMKPWHLSEKAWGSLPPERQRVVQADWLAKIKDPNEMIAQRRDHDAKLQVQLESHVGRFLRNVTRLGTYPEQFFSGGIASNYHRAFAPGSTTSKAAKVGWAILYHVWYFRPFAMLRKMFTFLINLIRDPLTELIGYGFFSKSVKKEIHEFVESPARHAMYSRVLETALQNLDILSAEDIQDVHQKTYADLSMQE